MSQRAARGGAVMFLAAALLLPAATARGQAAAPLATPDDDDSALPIPPVPPRIAEGADYEKCLELLDTDPRGADAMAATLSGDAGKHCHALALVALGSPEEGAASLEQLAASSAAPAAFRAQIYDQADEAWNMANNPPRAYQAATLALNLSPDDPDLQINHATVALDVQKPTEAVVDLTHALQLDPNRADALILRATAYRTLGELAPAQTDIARALAQDPQNPDGLLERGIIRQRAGDLEGARADWQEAADLAPDTATGDLAQQNLALLEAGPDQ